MKLGIVIPLKSKTVSKDWQTTCDSLRDTLQSITQQTSKNYSAIVVGHECPAFMTSEFKHIPFYSIDISPPDRDAPDFSHKSFIIDKNMKITKGMQLLNKGDISHWYALDSDDLIGKHFVEKTLQLDNNTGAILQGGYLLYKSRNLAIPCQDIHVYCGSTSVISNNFIDIPEQLTLETMQKMPWSRYAHMNMEEYFKNELNKPYEIVTEKFIGYVLGHGDNISDNWRKNIWKAAKAYLKPLILGKRLTKEFKANFSL